jgi:hypothetical protein
MRIVDGHDLRERFGKLDDDPIAVAQHRRMRNAIQLCPERLV